MWHWRSQPLAARTGSEIFAKLYAHETIATLLESPYPSVLPKLSRFSICAGKPIGEVLTPKIGEILPTMRRLLAEKKAPPAEVEHLPFTGGYIGWLGYDLAWELESLPEKNRDKLPFPVAYWYQPKSFAVLDHEAQTHSYLDRHKMNTSYSI